MSRVMSLKEAVQRFVSHGDTVGIGGQNIGRCPMAAVHEIIRQQKKDLTIVGCNLSFSMDILVGAGLVKETKSGTGNVERLGTTFMWRKGIEEGWLKHEDYSHIMMVSRFLAGEMGVPFMPVMTGFGTDIIHYNKNETFKIIQNPWNEEEKVILVPALCPDVSIVHVSRADEMGNIIVDGFTAHEPEMIKASKHVIATCEEIISVEEVRNNPALTTVPYFFVSAVIKEPFGAYPSSVYNYYNYDVEQVNNYQQLARSTLKDDGKKEEYNKYLKEYVFDCENYSDYLAKATTRENLESLVEKMKNICSGSG